MTPHPANVAMPMVAGRARRSRPRITTVRTISAAKKIGSQPVTSTYSRRPAGMFAPHTSVWNVSVASCCETNAPGAQTRNGTTRTAIVARLMSPYARQARPATARCRSTSGRITTANCLNATAHPNVIAERTNAIRPRRVSRSANTRSPSASTTTKAAETSFDPSIARNAPIPHVAYSTAGSATRSHPTRRPTTEITTVVRMPATVSTRVMSPKSACAGRYQSSSPGGYTSGEPGGIVEVSGTVYGLRPCCRFRMASCVARSTSLPSSSGARERRSLMPMSTAHQQMNLPWSRPVRLRPRRTTPAMSRTTRSSCGALSSIPPTHQNRPARIAASLAREDTEPCEVRLEGPQLLAVRREVAALERRLGVRVVIRGRAHELRDRRGGRRPRRPRRSRWPGARAGPGRRRRPRRRRDGRAPEQRVQRARERVGHRDLVLRRQDDALELRELAVIGLDEQRLDVEERVPDREDDEVPVDDLRSATDGEERGLLPDGRVGRDAGLDLERPEDRAALRQLQHPKLPVIGRVRP